MPWPTYSERFLHHQAAGAWIWTVPADTRAVVTNMDVWNGIAGRNYAALHVGPIVATLIDAPAQDFTKNLTLRVVAYQGEEIRLTIGTTGMHCTVSGYLFSDTSGATGPPGAIQYERLEAATPLPSQPLHR